MARSTARATIGTVLWVVTGMITTSAGATTLAPGDLVVAAQAAGSSGMIVRVNAWVLWVQSDRPRPNGESIRRWHPHAATPSRAECEAALARYIDHLAALSEDWIVMEGRSAAIYIGPIERYATVDLRCLPSGADPRLWRR